MLKIAAYSSLVLLLFSNCAHRRHMSDPYAAQPNDPNVTVNSTTVYNTPPATNAVVYTNPVVVAPPVVTITYPIMNFVSPGKFLTIQGNIQNIQSIHQINISQNGYPVRYFSYDPYSGNFNFQTFLQVGANNIIITASSNYGTGSQGVTVFFTPPYNRDHDDHDDHDNHGRPNTSNPYGVSNPTAGGNYTGNTGYPNGGNPNNPSNPNGNYPNNGGNYPNNPVNPNGNYPNNGGNYPNNPVNPNGNYPNNGGNTGTNPVNPNGNQNNGGNALANKPFVQITNPSQSPFLSNSATCNISATIQNINNPNQIMISLNGSNLTQFTYNSANRTLNFTANLLTGFNSIQIVASNAYGSDTKSAVIDYKPSGAPPRIAIFNPASSPFSSLQQNFIISGYVYNITSSSEILVTYNGSPVSFNYNTNTQEIDVPLNLSGSGNQVVIKATNASGSDMQQVNLLLVSKNCGPASGQTGALGGVTPGFHPTILNGITPHVNQGQNPGLQTNGEIHPNLNNPNVDPHVNQSGNPGFQTNGNVQTNINNANSTPHINQNPGLQTNGMVQPNITTNPSVSEPHINQNPGLHTNGEVRPNINVNTAGSGGNGMAGIHHAPEITRTSPTSSPFTTMSGVISISANVSFVTEASGVSVSFDGSPVSFSFNPQVGEQLNLTSPLRPGMNTFVIRATNAYGTSAQNIDINYIPTSQMGNGNGNPSVHFEPNKAMVRPTETINNPIKPIEINKGQKKPEPGK